MEFYTQIFSIFPSNPSDLLDDTLRSKRTQVKNACVNCQKACKKCDEGRPCQRCIKYGLGDTCRDSVRKERRKGERRGPYTKKETKPRYTTPHNEPHFSVISPNTTISKTQGFPRNIEQQQSLQRSVSPASSSGCVSDLLQTPPPSPGLRNDKELTIKRTHDERYNNFSSKESTESKCYSSAPLCLPSVPSLHAASMQENSPYSSWTASNLQLPPLTNHTQLPSFREILSSINC
ncbi:hypothetical protein K7432_007925 [Basidiobolus ranarum]|uniref:Zn(2)-C6 fungal-type domain-containing protein n=1 Tax=Basidiobolus ranarum TaxID=34480 RepID=A0ABR2WSL9_9FUNG